MTSDKIQSDFKLVADLLRSARHVLAITHLNPDGDALGSLCFFKELMIQLGKECTIYCAGPLPSSLQFLNCWAEIITDKTKLDLTHFDLLVSLDCATIERTNLADALGQRSKEQVFLEIDHHPAFKKVSDVALRITTAAATTEVLFALASNMKIDITPTMARALLTGIVTDTGHFVHPTVTHETIEAVSSIIKAGANLNKLYNQTAKNKTLAGLKIWGLALSRLTKNEANGVISTILTQADFNDLEVDDDVIEGISSFLSGLNEGKIFLLLYEKDGLIRGSLRSLAPEVDVSQVARSFGGGGHVKAAGFMIKGHLRLNNGSWEVSD